MLASLCLAVVTSAGRLHVRRLKLSANTNPPATPTHTMILVLHVAPCKWWLCDFTTSPSNEVPNMETVGDTEDRLCLIWTVRKRVLHFRWGSGRALEDDDK